MSKNSTRIVLTALLPLAVMLGACNNHGPSPTSPPVTTNPPPPATTPQGPLAPVHEGYIYLPSPNGTGDDNELVAQKVTFDNPDDPAREALNALVAAKGTPLASGSELRGVKIEDGLATVNFSPEFKSNFHGSDTQEAQAINSILKTLGQFPTISKVQILVDNAAVDSLGGHFEISDPLDVIRTTVDAKQARVYHKAQSH
ncbi:MAG: Sporulation and spore germination [Capsulimonas sp.]|nr:Sporulation and spore germination [Capsulimonas sp.]